MGIHKKRTTIHGLLVVLFLVLGTSVYADPPAEKSTDYKIKNTELFKTNFVSFTDKALRLTPPPFIVANRPATVTVTVDNTSTAGGGPFDDQMTVSGTLSNGLTILEINPEQGACEVFSGGFSCNLGTVDANTIVDITVQILAEISGSESFEANVESQSFDPDDTNNDDSINLEVLLPAGISGQKYEDLNGNGQKDDGEPGIEGWVITLNGEPLESSLEATTGSDGT